MEFSCSILAEDVELVVPFPLAAGGMLGAAELGELPPLFPPLFVPSKLRKKGYCLVFINR